MANGLLFYLTYVSCISAFVFTELSLQKWLTAATLKNIDKEIGGSIASKQINQNYMLYA